MPEDEPERPSRRERRRQFSVGVGAFYLKASWSYRTALYRTLKRGLSEQQVKNLPRNPAYKKLDELDSLQVLFPVWAQSGFDKKRDLVGDVGTKFDRPCVLNIEELTEIIFNEYRDSGNKTFSMSLVRARVKGVIEAAHEFNLIAYCPDESRGKERAFKGTLKLYELIHRMTQPLAGLMRDDPEQRGGD